MNKKITIVPWPITATTIIKRNTVKKEHLTNKIVLLTYKKGLLSYKQDLLTRKIATANSQIYNAEDGVEYPPCRRASGVNIKRTQVTSYKTIVSEMVRGLISKTTFQRSLKLSLVVCTFGARYGFKVPNCYLNVLRIND